MKKIIYSKYSNDRSENYKIRTDIVVDESGKRFARKTALTEACKSHIGAMYENYQRLTEEFKDTCIVMNRCERDGDALEFEYIEGKTYEVYLDELLLEEKEQEFLAAVGKFVTILESTAKKSFVMTDAFRAMFGETQSFEGEKCLAVSDVDMIFPNLMIRGETWEVLDYEWSYAIPIPVDFIIYRAFHYYEAGSRHMQLKEICNLFRVFGISQARCQEFERMEEHFQNFLVTGNTPLWQLYQTLGQKVYFPAGMVEAGRKEEDKKRVRVVKDYGDTTRNVDYYMTPAADENGRMRFDVAVDSDMKALIIYPAQCSCAITVYEALTVGFGTKKADFIRNGFSSDNKTIYYTVEDPYMLFPSLDADASKLRVEMAVSFPHKDVLIQSADVTEDNEKIRGELSVQLEENNVWYEKYHVLKEKYDGLYLVEQDRNTLQERVRALEEQKDEMNQRLDVQQQIAATLTSSISWKITKPIRGVKKIFGKLRRSV